MNQPTRWDAFINDRQLERRSFQQRRHVFDEIIDVATNKKSSTRDNCLSKLYAPIS